MMELKHIIPIVARREEAQQINEHVQTTGQLVSEEVTRKTADGPRDFLLQNAVFDNGSKAFAIYTDITERTKRKRELEILREAVDRAHIPIVLTDPLEDGNPLVYVNDAFEDVTGYSRSEATGRNCRFLQGEQTDQEKVTTLREAISEEKQVTVEIQNYRKDGSPFWNQVTIHPIYDEDGELIRFFGSQEDITEDKEARQQLEQQNDRLEEFVDIVSHDLRNPLSVAQARLELVEQECSSEHLKFVRNAHTRIGTLIDDLRTIAQKGDTVRETERVDLETMVKRCWQTVDTKDASLEIEETAPLVADQSRLQQLFENLVRNALDHIDGVPNIRVGLLEPIQTSTRSMEEVNPDGFFIADDGPGIPEAKRDKLFESGYTTTEEGTGFGLAIVEQIVDAHDWTISVTQSKSGGARFDITDMEFVPDSENSTEWIS